jgi:hypothetical protein
LSAPSMAKKMHFGMAKVVDRLSEFFYSIS